MFKYFITPEVLLQYVPRNGSTSFSQAIIDCFYPEIKIKQQRNNVPVFPQFLLPYTLSANKPIIFLVRDPIERFLSGASIMLKKFTIDDIITMLINKKTRLEYIQKQVDFINYDHIQLINFFKFPENINHVCKMLRIPHIEHLNKSVDKPTLTQEQFLRLNEFYKEDYELINNINSAKSNETSTTPTPTGA